MATIPKQANWPTMENVCVSFDIVDETRPLRIRRLAWEVTVGEDQVADKWIYYDDGIWFIEDAVSRRIVSASEFTEEDFLGEDWTSLSVTCFGTKTVSCDSISDSYIEGYYTNGPIEEFQPPLSSPNSGSCDDECALPEQPLQDSYSDGVGADSADGAVNSGGGGGGGGGGSGRVRKRKKPKAATPASLEFGEIISDIPECIPLIEDDQGRLCDDPENPYDYNVSGTSITLSDIDNPNQLWFVKVHFKANLVANNVMRHGDSVDVTIPSELGDGKLRWGASHSISASGWCGGRTLSASASVTMSEPCDPDPNCGQPGSGA